MREDTRRQLRSLPSVEELVQHPRISSLLAHHPRRLVVNAIRHVIASARKQILEHDLENSSAGSPNSDALVEQVVEEVARRARPSLRRVINASGVVVHTNLGRSLLAPSAVEQVVEVSSHYCTLEYRLESGERGSRHDHIEELLLQLTGAEAAMVVNNNAAATLLTLMALAAGREVIVSRGQLVEIGGSFRIPEIMQLSGARLVEVGTTNKTRISDYAFAITPDTALLARIHTSNYRIVGFTEEPRLEELVALAHNHGLLLVDDLGSGALADLPAFQDEPHVRESVAAGVDVALWSGDKLLGGPQAGIIVGRRDCIEQMKRHPLARAVRVDKMTLAALEATLRLYLDPERAQQEIPTLKFLSRSSEEIRALAEQLSCLLRLPPGLSASVVPTKAKVGGGALPLLELPSSALMVQVNPEARATVQDIERWLRLVPPPYVPAVGRIENESLVLDMIAVTGVELEPLAASLNWAAAQAISGESRHASPQP